jgi:general secretion pathway protein E
MTAQLASSNLDSAEDAPTDELSRLAEMMVASGTVDQQSLDRALRIAAEVGRPIDRVITQLGMVSERGLAEVLGQLVGAPVLEPADYPDEPLFPDLLRPKFLRKARALPIADKPEGVVVAVADPLNRFIPKSLAAALRRRTTIAVAVPAELEAALNRLYPETEEGTERGARATGIAVEDERSEEDTERLKDLASEAPVIRLVNQLISRAVETGASDVHIETFENRLRVRYRYDGILHEAEPPPPRLHTAVISRIKIMARLDIAERRLPQDGRIRLTVRGRDIDFRVSTVPSLYGESVVLRVLDRSAIELDFVKLGLPDDIRKGLAHALNLPNGMVLVTGPTGSGKTTTLYTGLSQLNSIERNIVTVEDPIEYQLAGINQIQVKPQIGLDFASLLRSILRQDPNVIMIGEIRDLETAQIAVQAALTGHLVLSTLHTNSAAGTVTRLHDMGIEDYLLASTLKAILAQRLVRRLCPKCKAPERRGVPVGLERLVPKGTEISLKRPIGCPECRGTGYRGRRAIAELLVESPDIERAILDHGDQTAIERAAIKDGMRPIFDTGLLAVIEGDTSFEEIVRCIRGEA